MSSARASTAILVLAYLAFISLGLPDALLGVAWPSLRDDLGVHQALLGAPLAVGACAYFLSGILAGRLIQGLGIGLLLATSTALVAAGLFGISAASAFALILLAALVMGLGSGAIDAALNTYAARFFGARHMSWLHAAYAVGATTGPVIMTTVLGRGGTWRLGYAVVASMLAALAIAFIGLRRRWAGPPAPQGPEEGSATATEDSPPRTSGLLALRSGPVRLQLLLFFVYAGLEVSAGQWSYTLLTEERGFGATSAGSWVAAYWGGLLVGRVVLGFVVDRIGQVRLVRLASVGAVLASVLFAIPGWSGSVLGLPLLSFSLASIYPGLMTETPRRVGQHLAAHAVGFQVSAATLGVAVMPSLAGLVSERIGLGAIPPLLACAALLFFLLHERLVATTDHTR
ncbi:MFS transporter [Myxococcus stipitatus]|uniref:MFS transporter n=1 Tax=Myxococcus stipitatus TaxID=83455 RepID=UPI001F484516|nr:MFS transporter [Myxococcus stipitatus]MCE9667617.1 MFS transporter [Myxococcus stipitatus]